MRPSRVFTAAAALLAAAISAGAQDRIAHPLSVAAGSAVQSGAAQAPAAAPAQPPISAGEDGFIVQSPDGDFRLQIGLLLHADGRFAVDDSNDQVVNAFVIRRVRPSFRGRLFRRFEFYLNPDFAGGNLVVHDAYVDTVFAPAFRVRLGKAKTPFGFERLHSAAAMLFFERAFPTALAPNRDIGVQVLGDISGGVVSYLAGVMNGVADGASSDAETNDAKDVSGRLVVKPFNRIAASPVRGLGLGISGSRGEQTGANALPSFRTQSLQQPFFSYSGAIADGVRTRYSPQLFYFHKAFAGWAEYVHTETPITGGGVVRQDIAHDAWQAAASFVLTGEPVTDTGIVSRPRNAFDFGNGNRGAFQVAARYHVLEVDEEAITLGLAAPGASRKAESWTAGVRWYATRNVWYTLNFERTVFDGDPDGPRAAENALVFRSQISF